MKKFQLKNKLILTLSILCIMVTHGQIVQNALAQKDPSPLQEKLAYVSLDPELHPAYAPIVSIEDKAMAGSKTPQDKLRAATLYGILFMQILAGGLIYLAGPVAVLVIAIAGLRYVVSHGEQGEMDAAKKTLTYAIVGLIVIILSYAIIKAILVAGTSLI